MKKLNKNRFCVYKLTKPWDMLPIYIGKGSIERSLEHKDHSLRGIHENDHLQNVFLKAKRLKQEIIIEYLAVNLTNDEAKELEIKYIAEIGRDDLETGPLANKTAGGEGATGRLASPEQREKARRAKLGKKNSIETNRKISEKVRGENHPFYGRTHSDETKENWSKKRKGVVLTEDHKDSISKGVTKNWEKRRYYPLSDSTRQKRRENALKQWAKRREQTTI